MPNPYYAESDYNGEYRVFEHHTHSTRRLILAMLDAPADVKDEDISIDNMMFRGMGREFYEDPCVIPFGAELVFEIKELHSNNFTWGSLGLYKLNGKLFVAEECASPIMFYCLKSSLVNSFLN